jgi:hypothetical protein
VLQHQIQGRQSGGRMAQGTAFADGRGQQQTVQAVASC